MPSATISADGTARKRGSAQTKITAQTGVTARSNVTSRTDKRNGRAENPSVTGQQQGARDCYTAFTCSKEG